MKHVSSFCHVHYSSYKQLLPLQSLSLGLKEKKKETIVKTSLENFAASLENARLEILRRRRRLQATLVLTGSLRQDVMNFYKVKHGGGSSSHDQSYPRLLDYLSD